MTKEKFLKELKHNLRYLNNKNRNIELSNYYNLDSYDLDPLTEANKIYAKYSSKIKIYPKISLYDAIYIFIRNIKNKTNIKPIVLFFLYLLFLLIILKIPFIYVRDITSSFFNISFTNNFNIIWNLAFEIIYAITTIIIFIKLIKKKAHELDN